jgi:NADH-quinone oxidoreductase subunit G
MINIKINDQEIAVEEGTTIIQAADLLKIPIPRFCYHEKLSISANCRMCLVEVSNVSKLLPACATYVTEGMQIFTQSEKTITGQKGVMEFLLVNHPLECPICDQAGECELQDLSIQFGNDASCFKEEKRSVVDQNLGPLIATNMTRCIHCTRCVRFGEEIAGTRELGAISRGENMKISTFIEKNIDSEVSGNIIDLCPVGALTSKPYQFSARPWELQQKASISCHDCLGSNINYHVNNGQIKRAVPRNNPSINSIWLSDRDRFSYTGINSQDRLKYPLLRRDGKWQSVSWQEAISFIVDKLSIIIQKHGASQIGGLISPSASLEECYLFQKLFRSLGSNNIDHRLRQIDFREQELAPLYPNLGLATVDELKNQQFVLLIGSYLNKEQPIAGIILREAVKRGGLIAVVNSVDFEFNFDVHYKYITPYADLLTPLLKIAKAVADFSKEHLPIEAKNLLENIEYDQLDITIAQKLLFFEPTKSSIILGALAINHPDYSKIVAISNLICLLTKAKFGCFSDGANSAGAWLAGCVPHRTPSTILSTDGKNALQMLTQVLKAYILLGIEPELDCASVHGAAKVLQQAELVVAITAFESNLLLQYAEVLLPMAAPQEGSGTYINITGIWQKSEQIATTIGVGRSAAEILLMLGKSLKSQGFINFNNEDIVNIEHIIKQAVAANTTLDVSWQQWYPNIIDLNRSDQIDKLNNFVCVAPLSLYAIDPITRRSECLQTTKDQEVEVFINFNSAKLLEIKNGDIIKITLINNLDYKLSKIIKLPITISNKVADGCVLLKQVNLMTAMGLPYNNVLLEKIVLENAHA